MNRSARMDRAKRKRIVGLETAEKIYLENPRSGRGI